MLSVISRPGEVLWVLSEPESRSGEMTSPQRDDLASARCLGHVWCFACILAQARWEWVFGRTCDSPRRDGVFGC